MPRIAAAEALSAVETRDAFSNLAIDAQVRRRKLSATDAALAASITYGVLKNRSQLDAALNRWLKKPIKSLEPFTRAVLRSGAFQLLYLDRVPSHAAVSESVAILKRRKRHRAGLCNAVLRRVSEHTAELRELFRAPITDALTLSHSCGIPVRLAESLIDRHGLDEAIAYGLAIQRPAPLTLRSRSAANRQALVEALSAEGVDATPTKYSPAGIRIRRGGRASELRPVEEGLAVVQDEASQLISTFADPKPKNVIIDLCAGRGGKTFHLADQIGDQGRVIASDRSAKKLEALQVSATRLGLTSIEIRAQESLEPRCADVVVVDAPCSGLGVIRRHPELRWKYSRSRTDELVREQRALLKIGAELVAPHGLLVYAVCSDQPEEGREQISWFLSQTSAFERADPPESFDWEGLLTEEGDLLTLPHLHGTDGFYAARLRRT